MSRDPALLAALNDSQCGLSSEWRELWNACPSATPFQSPAWLIPWWENFGGPQNARLITLALYKEQKLIGLAPLFIQRQPDETRTALLLGTGNSDYLDILLSPDFAQSGTAAIWDYLASQAHRWDVCDFQNLQAGSLLCSADIDCANLQTQDICPVLTLPSAKEALSARVPSQILANFRYYRRRAEKLGRLQLERATPENLNSFLETFIELHQARWLARGGAGVLADVAIQQFHREAGPELLGEGLLRLYLLRLGGRPLAALYALAARQRFYYYLSGFDPEFSALSPGTLVIGHVIEQAIEEGFLEFDFLRGRESYKYHWGAQERPIFRLQIRSNGGSGRPQEPHGAGSLPLAVP